MKLSRTISYAIQAMLRLAEYQEGVPIPCSKLARAGQMPERFLLQILRSLVTHGLLHSTRGVDGGYFLARPPQQITLCDILESFDNPMNSRLPEINGTSPQLRDSVLKTLRHASQAARAELRKLTLAALMHADNNEGSSNGVPLVRASKFDYKLALPGY